MYNNRSAYQPGVAIILLLALNLAACAAVTAPGTATPSATTPRPSVTPSQVPSTPTPTLEPATPTAQAIDYAPLVDALEEYLAGRVYDNGFDLGVGFVDIETGQEINIQGDTRYHAMSSFKGPLAVRYYEMLEAGEIERLDTDLKHLTSMLRVSYNQSTTCILERTGGLPAFNDWLAQQGFTRELSFVFTWQEWACPPGEGAPADQRPPDIDWRYYRGDEALSLPGGGALLRCPIPQLPCDKAFAPIELARFYARLYRGEYVHDPAHREELFGLLERVKDETPFLIALPDDANIHVYSKGGTFQATEVYRVNFFVEAGIIETDAGAFALAMFMQRQPDWPGTWPMAKATQMIYDYFMGVHGPPDA